MRTKPLKILQWIFGLSALAFLILWCLSWILSVTIGLLNLQSIAIALHVPDLVIVLIVVWVNPLFYILIGLEIIHQVFKKLGERAERRESDQLKQETKQMIDKGKQAQPRAVTTSTPTPKAKAFKILKWIFNVSCILFLTLWFVTYSSVLISPVGMSFIQSLAALFNVHWWIIVAIFIFTNPFFGLGIVIGILSGVFAKLEKHYKKRETEQMIDSARETQKQQVVSSKGVSCSNCGFQNKPSANFCKKCGRELKTAEAVVEKVKKDESIDDLIEMLQKGDENARKSAVRALLKIGNAEAARALVRALGDDNKDIVSHAYNGFSGTTQSLAKMTFLPMRSSSFCRSSAYFFERSATKSHSSPGPFHQKWRMRKKELYLPNLMG